MLWKFLVLKEQVRVGDSYDSPYFSSSLRPVHSNVFTCHRNHIGH